METVFSTSALPESSENETATHRDKMLNFISWLKEQQEHCSEITANNIEGFKLSESKLAKNIKERGSGIKENIETAIVSLKKTQNLNESKELLKDTIDNIEDCEQKLAKLETEIKVLEKEHENNKKINMKIVAYKKAIQHYERNFNLKSKVLSSNEDQTIIETVFENKTDYPVKMVLGKNNDILSFELNSNKVTKEYKEITAWFAENKNPVGLMIKLRTYILNLNE